MRVVITECDHDAFDQENSAAAAAGLDLTIANARTADELIRAAEGADAIVVQYATIDAAILDALPTVRAIGRYGVGYDSVDIAAATARGIAVCNVPDYGTDAVADHAIALALAASREIPRLDRALRAGVVDFPGIRPLHLIGERTFGVLGLGRIGSATARRAAGLGYRVLCHDVLGGDAPTFRGVEHVGFTELLERSQVVSLHTPLDATTRHLIDADALALMRPDATLVNTSRGGVVDTAALVDALRAGQLRSAALDVTEVEPLPVGHALMDLPNVVLTPHTAWYSEESYAELKRRVIENVADVLAGRRPRDIVNPEVLAAAP